MEAFYEKILYTYFNECKKLGAPGKILKYLCPLMAMLSIIGIPIYVYYYSKVISIIFFFVSLKYYYIHFFTNLSLIALFCSTITFIAFILTFIYDIIMLFLLKFGVKKMKIN